MTTLPVDEVPWVLLANGVRVASGTASPGEERPLAAGRLLAEGLVRSPAELLSITAHSGDPVTRIVAGIDAAVCDAGLAEQRHRAEHDCGLTHFVTCDASAARRPRALRLPGDDVAELLRLLYAACDARFPNGGVHAAALTDGTSLRHVTADVGRHNAVEKVTGMAFLAREDPAVLGLLVTARISGQMALSAARGGVSWVASRSVPTTLAVAIARAAGLPLIGRAASRDRRVFAVEESSRA